MKMTNCMLKSISKQIDTGRAITAIATANQYLKKDCPLRLALVRKANSHLKSTDRLTARILKGEQVSHKQLMQVVSENTNNTNSSSRKFIVPSDYSLQYKRCSDLRRRISPSLTSNV